MGVRVQELGLLPLRTWHRVRTEAFMLRIVDRRGRELDWESFARLYVTSYSLVAETQLDAGGGGVRIVTGWHGLVGVGDDGCDVLPYVTTVYGGPHDDWSRGWPTLIGAIRGHAAVVAALEAGRQLLGDDRPTPGADAR
jgi:hypothetical protein